MVDPRTPEGERIGMSRYCDHLERRVADLEADLSNTLRAVLYHFGPDGAHKVTTTALELRKPIR